MTENMAARKRQRDRTAEQNKAPLQDGSLEHVTAETDEGQEDSSREVEDEGPFRSTPAE